MSRGTEPGIAAVTPVSPTDLDRFRSYLLILARMQFSAGLRSKMDPSDVVQQTLLRAVEAKDQFRGASRSELAAWLRRILSNTLADAARAYSADKRNITLEQSLAADIDRSSVQLELLAPSSPSGKVAQFEQLERLAAALTELPADQATMIELHHLQGWPVGQVARHTNRTEAAVAGLLRRGLKRLRELMPE